MMTIRRTGGLLAVLLFAASGGVVLSACDEGSSESDDANDEEDNASTEESISGDSGARADASLVADAGARAGEQVLADAGTHADASTGVYELGTFDGTIVAAAMSKTVGGGKGPFWLYRGGVSPTDEKGLLPVSAEALKHRAANPDLWIEWRRMADGAVERKTTSGWQPLAFDDEYAGLTKGASFVGTFESYQTAGDIAGRIRKYRFSKSGSYELCELFVGGPSISESRASGTYEVDGYVIRLTSKSGTKQAFSIVYDPSLRPNTMWIDRTMLTRDNGASVTEPLDC